MDVDLKHVGKKAILAYQFYEVLEIFIHKKKRRRENGTEFGGIGFYNKRITGQKKTQRKRPQR